MLTQSVTRLPATHLVKIKVAWLQALLGLNLSHMMALDLILEKPVAVQAQQREIVALPAQVAKFVDPARLVQP